MSNTSIMWALHNMVGHPLMALLDLLGLERAGLWIHDVTLPRSARHRNNQEG